MIEVELRGLPELVAALRALGQAVPRDELERDAVELSQPVAEAMAARAPKRTGRYAQSFAAQAVRPDQPGHVRVLIGPTLARRSRGFIGRFLEFGTWRIAPRPHIRPGWDAKKDPLRAALREKVRARWIAQGRALGFRVTEAA